MNSQEKLALLERFAPILKFTKGEQFFPMDVERYVKSCSLWLHRPGIGAERIYDEGEITLNKLAEKRSENFGNVQYLKFIEPLRIAQLASYRMKSLRRDYRQAAFHAGPGRLSRVGYSARIMDAIFSLTLLARGRVPGDTAAAAALSYRELQAKDEGYSYYGRIVEEDGWTVLQYWYFYPFNNWRSGYFGLNDHEADWEMVSIFLYENESSDLQAEWVGYANHDFEGDDLRRHWDDKVLDKEGEHAIVYVGAGSHASFFQAGEYLTELVIPLLSPLVSLSKRLSGFWRKLLGEELASEDGAKQHLFHIPFVDYARGEGLSIGLGQENNWTGSELISENNEWVRDYRGLWGLWTNDPVMGEIAPGGPMYDRFGRVRHAWYDPLGWLGLNKIGPPNQALSRVENGKKKIERRQKRIEKIMGEKRDKLRDMDLEAQAMLSQAHMQKAYKEHQEGIEELAEEIREIGAKIADDQALGQAMQEYSMALEKGQQVNRRGHLKRPQIPSPEIILRFSRLAEAWAAMSIGLALIAFVGIALFAPNYLLTGALITMGVILVVEAAFKRRLNRLANILTGILAFLAGTILVFEFFVTFFIAFILIAGGYILWENLRELWS